MADTSITIRIGEKRPITTSIALPSGMLTITAATYTLYTSNTPVAGRVSIPCTGFDSTPAGLVHAWVLFDTLLPTALSAQVYVLAFSVTATGTDGMQRIYEPNVQITVVSPGT
jgi:hypothetical protein